mgnify:CR=1 FL=1
MDKEKIKKMLIQLLQEDEEFRYTVVGILATVFVRKDELRDLIAEIKQLREDFNKQIIALRRDFNERIVAIEQRIEEMRRDFNERIVAIEQRIEEMRRDFNEQILRLNRSVRSLECSIGAIGARWGVLSEDAFRSALRGILENWFGVKVTKWEAYDDEGIVYGYPSIVDADVVIKDRKHILIEIKAHVRRSDVAEIMNIAKVYEKKEGVKPDLVIVSPYVEEKAKELAKIHGVQIYTPAELM